MVNAPLLIPVNVENASKGFRRREFMINFCDVPRDCILFKINHGLVSRETWIVFEYLSNVEEVGDMSRPKVLVSKVETLNVEA